MRTIRTLALALLFAAPAVPAAAQQTPEPAAPAGPELVNRVVAVVGDTALLLSDVQAELQQLRQQGQFPTDPLAQEQLVTEVVEQRVGDLVLLQAARDALIIVTDEQVDELVDQNIRQVQQRFGSEAEFERALAESGRTLAQYRYELAQQQRAQLTIQQFLQQRLRELPTPLVSEDQVRAAFEQARGSFGTRPATLSLEQVIVAPQPSDSAREAARAEANQVLAELAEGVEFEVLARRYSDDPGSAEHGGDLGWFRRGRMVPEFERVAFALRPGQTSGIVESDFGYHIIRVEKARGPERQARHILIRPEITEADVQRARAQVDSVLAAVQAGADIDQLSQRYDTPAAEAVVEDVPVDRLPGPYSEPLRGAQPGQVVGPVELDQGQGPRWAVVRVTERAEAGPYTLDDLRDRITQRLQEQRMVQQLVEDLRRTMYVDVRI